MSDGKIFERNRERNPKNALQNLLLQCPLLLSTMAWGCILLGLSLAQTPLSSTLLLLIGGLGWMLSLSQFRFFKLSLLGELVFLMLLLLSIPSAAEWTSTGFFLSFLGRGFSFLARRMQLS